MNESEIAFAGGSPWTKRAGNPKPETATATLASPPPECCDELRRLL